MIEIKTHENTFKQIPSDNVAIVIPECCREGWESCPHVVNKVEIKKKTNIAL